LAWSKRNITQKLSKLEGGGACDFAREDDCIGWKGGCGENFFSKSIRIMFHEDCPLVTFFVKKKKNQMLGVF